MKLSEVERNVDATENGAWIGKKYGMAIPGMGDLCIRTRSSRNAQWQTLFDKLLGELPLHRRLSVSVADRTEIAAQCCLAHGILDWDCIENADGSLLTFSAEQAKVFLTEPKFAELRDAALWAAGVVGTAAAEALRTDIKN